MSRTGRNASLALFAGLVVCVGCGSAQAPLQHEPITAAPPAGTPEPAASPAELVMSTALARPTDVACAYRTLAWQVGGQPQFLMVTPGGRVFAEVNGVPSAELVVATSEGSHDTWVSAEHGGVQVVGWLALDGLRLRPARAIPIQDFGVVQCDARLAITRADVGQLTIEVQAVGAFNPAALLSMAQPCDALSPNVVVYDARASLPVPSAEHPQRVSMSTGVERPLVATLGGEARGTVLSDTIQIVERLESRGRSTRILLHDRDALFFGWVPSAGLARVTTPELGHDVALADAAPRQVPPGGVALGCPDAFPLIAELAGERIRVGTVAAATRLLVDPGGDGDRTFSLDWLAPTPNARFILPAATAARCVAR